MKKTPIHIVLILILSIVPAAADAASSRKVESNPAGHLVVVDGDSSDWEELDKFYLKDTLRVVGVAHDEDALYIMFRFGEPALAKFISLRGVMFWMNGDAKTSNKKEEFGVRYPGSHQIALEFAEDSPWTAKSEAEAAKQDKDDGPKIRLDSLRQVPGDLTVVRMGAKEIFEETNDEGPSAASTVKEGLFSYELRIPFSDIGGKISDASPAKNRELAVGIMIGGITKEEEKVVQKEIKEQIEDEQGFGSSSSAPQAQQDPRRFKDRAGMTGSIGSMSGMDGRSGNQSSAYAARNRRSTDSGIVWLSITLPPVGKDD